jgi:hypothetical protein
MSNRRLLLVVIPVVAIPVVLLLAGGAVWGLARPKPATLTIEVSGTAGLPIKGTFEVDGTPKELTGVVPTKFVVEGKRITFLLTTTANDGEFRLRTTVNDNVYLPPSGSGKPPKNSVRGWVNTSWGWSPPTGWIEPFDKDAKPDWLKPPP